MNFVPKKHKKWYDVHMHMVKHAVRLDSEADLGWKDNNLELCCSLISYHYNVFCIMSNLDYPNFNYLLFMEERERN